MNGAIFYDTKYGSTRQYADWIGAATGLPVYSVADPEANPERFDFLVLGSPVIYYKVLIRRWVELHLDALLERPVILFTVSGARPGAKLDGWVSESLPRAFVDHARRFALQGRMDPKKLGWWDRIMLQIGGRKNPDREAGREEIEGFDFMDRASIGPVVAAVRELVRAEAA